MRYTPDAVRSRTPSMIDDRRTIGSETRIHLRQRAGSQTPRSAPWYRRDPDMPRPVSLRAAVGDFISVGGEGRPPNDRRVRQHIAHLPGPQILQDQGTARALIGE